jgi:hypothetical protein
MYTKLKIIALTAVLALSSCEPIRDSYAECGVWLEFIFDYNMEFADSFDSQVKTVDVFIFDGEGKFALAKHAAVGDLEGHKRMFIGNGLLPFGKYRILTVGNLCAPFRFTHRGNLLIPGVTTIEEVLLALDTKEASREFGHLFFGPDMEVNFRADQSVWPVPLVRETNRFSILLQTQTESSEGGMRAEIDPMHAIEIVAPESGAYDYLHNPADQNELTYRPYFIQSSIDYEDKAVVRQTIAHINTMRLLENHGNGYRLSVRDVASGKEIWNKDLLPLLSGAHSPFRPDGTGLPNGEYLDRECDWHIVIIYTYNDPGGTIPPNTDLEGVFKALKIIVNNWIVWENEMVVM